MRNIFPANSDIRLDALAQLTSIGQLCLVRVRFCKAEDARRRVWLRSQQPGAVHLKPSVSRHPGAMTSISSNLALHEFLLSR
jgi:hypothetical protein